MTIEPCSLLPPITPYSSKSRLLFPVASMIRRASDVSKCETNNIAYGIYLIVSIYENSLTVQKCLAIEHQAKLATP